MGRVKLIRFQVNSERRNVIEPGKEIFEKIRGHWNEFFHNNNLIVLELGCGRGEYTTGLAANFPDRNFVGVDIKGSRIWKGSTVAFENGLDNVAFLRTKIQNIEDFFAPGEIGEIWITFPDPRPKEKDARRRLTHPRFLAMYRRLMGSGGIINFKTDNLSLFEYTLSLIDDPACGIRLLECTRDLYNSDLLDMHYGIQTTYEKKFLGSGIKINFLRMKFLK